MSDSWMWTPVKVSPAVNWLSLTTAPVEPTKNRQMPGPHVTVFRVNCTPVAKPVIPSLLATAGPSDDALASSTSRSTVTPAPFRPASSVTTTVAGVGQAAAPPTENDGVAASDGASGRCVSAQPASNVATMSTAATG